MTKRTIKAWAFPYRKTLACPDSRPDLILVQRGPMPHGMVACEPGQSQLDGTVCYARRVTITWDEPRKPKPGKP